MSGQSMPGLFPTGAAWGPMFSRMEQEHPCRSIESLSPPALVVALKGGPMHRGSRQLTRLCRVLEFIERHIEERLPISRLADVACLSRFHFARAFRSSTGKSPLQYINERRTEYAKKLLRETTKSVVEVAMICSFSSHANFCRAFRRETGMAPSEYRSVVIGA